MFLKRNFRSALSERNVESQNKNQKQNIIEQETKRNKRKSSPTSHNKKNDKERKKDQVQKNTNIQKLSKQKKKRKEKEKISQRQKGKIPNKLLLEFKFYLFR